MNKVFCQECKHHYGNRCASNASDTYFGPALKYAKCSEKNANNDCGEFEDAPAPKPIPAPPPGPPNRIIHYPAPWSWKFWK